MIGNVILDAKVMHAMDGHRTVEGVMDGVVPYIRPMDCTHHVEVDGVSPKDEGLANMSELNAIDAAGCRFITRRVADDNSAILVVRRVLWITSENNVASQEADLSTHLNCFGTESLDTGVSFSE